MSRQLSGVFPGTGRIQLTIQHDVIADVRVVDSSTETQPDDELLPAELRGMGIRIEDDLVITADGAQLMSGALPRTADGVEEWMGGLLTR